ncbi:SLC13 family permease [Psychrobacter sp. NZS113]|jgi:di/tricarboxylate transporter|uniref:SLC13 family permease n=1 Tax=Psychrobacter sp. NZS113 TaxID=2792045 RepID=UPI0018CDBCEE|nr:SLC13 family permease [Psychrobacter sp. NZS113]MBH0096057.1 SLC13 family permease [Psychrobacter sp. NZS113]
MTLYIIAAIVISIALGYITKINIGLFAIVFSYLIGCFGMELSAYEVIELWPLKIFFVIFAVTLFYNFPLANGALEKLCSHLIYKCRHFPALLPLVIFFVATIVAGLGAGYYTVLATMAPMILLLAKRTNLNIIIATLSVNYGALAGANFVTSQSGVIFRELMRGAGVANDNTFTYALGIFTATFLMPIVVLGIYSIINAKNSRIAIQTVMPEPLDSKQKKSIMLIFIMMAVVLIVPILNLLIPNVETIQFLNARIDIGFIALFFALVSLILKLGDEKVVIALIPWNTLIMICGVGMLISLGVEIGVVYELTEWLSTNVPIWMIPILVFIISAIMSVFASTLGVVAPTLFPMVPALAVASGLNPLLLFICIVMGAQSSSISPFSSGGSLILGASQVHIDKNQLLNTLLFKAVPLGIVVGLLAIFVIQLLF